ncbi:MAG: DUF2202 domain-containing protein [Bacteroidota bacterium]|nr:DUF2202 domain-containing protein [Bacteroidota bacterium]
MKDKKISAIVVLISILLVAFSTQNVSAQLSSNEKAGLIYMYEEEKLAHDVYFFLSKKYTIPVFKNINRSEAYHMSMVLDLIKKYELNDPSGKALGQFENKELQSLYNNLTEKGSKSIVDALEVGATIEDVDIFDLEKLEKEAKNTDIKKLYELLICGSENHMRAFTGHLEFKNVPYSPQYISKSRYEEIKTSEHKRCIELK